MKKLGQVCSKRHVPPELCTEILCRLPVKSLLRFRCVSKSWLSLIGSRDFARVHLNNFKNNHEETHLLVAQSVQQNVFVRRSDTFEADSKRLVTLGQGSWEWDFVSSIDGLFLLKRGRGELKVWNPSIRKFHEFPSLPRIATPPNSYVWNEEIGLGYDPEANDYKHVKLMFGNDRAPSVAIYSLGTGSWKVVPFQGKGCSGHWTIEGLDRRYGDPVFNKRNVCYRGSVQFIARDWNQHYGRDLVSFDLSSETFSSIRLLPDIGDTFALIDGGCSLAACSSTSSSHYSEWTVWVLESSGDGSKSECWTKRYSFHLKPKLELIYIKKDGDILTRSIRYEREIDETGKKVVKRWDRVASYHANTDEYKTVQEKSGSYMIRLVSAYVESLILLN